MVGADDLGKGIGVARLEGSDQTAVIVGVEGL
jgi:hypothetical protein